MKNFWNFLNEHIKENEEDWEELEEYTEDEYYADDSEYSDEEYYSDEEGCVEDGYYAEGEGYAEDGYCAEDEDYAEDGYYADGEGYAEDGYYAEGEDYAEDGYYADGEDYAEDGYYADGEDYAEDGYYAEGEDYTDEAYYADDEFYVEDEYYEEEWKDSDSNNIFDKIKFAFQNMDMVDRIVACTGVAVLILALVTGSVFASNRLAVKQVNSFVGVGNQLEGITVIGGDGLMAVADSMMARQEAAEFITDEEDEGHEGYDEEEYSNEVTVVLNMTSIKKDLKIKFVNKKTGKLIPNIPFVVDVTDPKGKTSTWTDDDKDGIIYKTEIAHGEYTVAMQALEGYDDYKISTSAKPVNVKENIEYEKVDVSDEIKTEAEIDASKEDTAQNEVEQESSLQDTVAWVESTKVPNGETYVEVSKATIEEPKVARFNNFVKLAGNNGETVSISGGGSVAATGTLELSAVTNGFPTEGVTYKWSISGTVASIEGSDSGSSVRIKGNNTSTTPQTVSVTVTVTSTVNDTVSGNIIYQADNSVDITVGAATQEISLALDKASGEVKVNEELSLTLTITGDAGTVSWDSSDKSVATVTGTDSGAIVKGLKAGTTTITASGSGKTASCTVSVTETSAAEIKITLNKTNDKLAVKNTLNLDATITGATSVATITWKSSNESVATVKGEGAKATVTGVKTGDAIIEVTCTEGNKTGKATCEVKVTDNAIIITLDRTSGTILVGNTLDIVPTITNATSTTKIVWTSSDEKIAKVTGDNTKATVTGVAAGDVKITASYTEGSTTVTAECTIKVQANPALDTTTALKDKSGNQLYVLNANGQYVAATYADYFKANQKFYMKQQAYKYTGWQTIDGGVYYFDASGKKVTGAQVIQGAQYSFDSNGRMVSSNGILGIDVSKWNGNIDWNAVKNSGVSYVIIRCGYRGSTAGALVEDPKYRTNIQGASAAGLKVGVYFFTQAINEVEAVEEASMVLSQVKGYKISYPIFLDVESSGGRADGISKATRTAVCKAFCQTIKNSGYTAGVYANKTWFNSYIDASQLGAYRIWLAQYAAQPTYSGRYDIWQYSSKGRVGGISGNVDMNLSYMGY